MFSPSPLHTQGHHSPTPQRSKAPPTPQAPTHLRHSVLPCPYLAPQRSSSPSYPVLLTALLNPMLQRHTREAFPSTALEPACTVLLASSKPPFFFFFTLLHFPTCSLYKRSAQPRTGTLFHTVLSPQFPE